MCVTFCFYRLQNQIAENIIYLIISECTLPSTPTNGIVSVSDTPTGSVARYTCQNGFTLKGLSSRQCKAQGLGWEDSDPSCGLYLLVFTLQA